MALCLFVRSIVPPSRMWDDPDGITAAIQACGSSGLACFQAVRLETSLSYSGLLMKSVIEMCLALGAACLALSVSVS